MRKNTRCYISGPMTGRTLRNIFTSFEVGEDEARRQGFIPVSPLDNGVPLGASHEEHMKADIRMLKTCQAIYLLSGWEDSKGAKRELKEAKELGLIIIDQHNYWVENNPF